jgi:ribosomal-protein-alanine N-acetyltransferase
MMKAPADGSTLMELGSHILSMLPSGARDRPSGMAFPDSFTTARLQAERLMAAHLSELRRMHTDPVVMAHLGGLRTPDQTAAYLDRNLRHWEEQGFGLWIVRELGGGEPIGRALLRTLRLDAIDEIEVGYALYEPYWGRGLATEITAACLTFARENLRRTTAVAVTSPTNFASQRVLQKSGLVYERDIDHEGALAALFRVRW